MFDWNDEELTNIIWGEVGESDDHIVPYPDGNEEKPSGLYGNDTKNERNQGAAEVKFAEQKKTVAKTDLRETKLDSSSQYNAIGLSATGVSIEWPDLSLPNAAKTDPHSMGTGASKNLTEMSKYDSSRHDEMQKPDDCSEIFQNQQHEDREECDFVNYGWANIGSFDDLHRIFSNEDPIFGNVSLGNTDELWSSSKDVSSSPEKSIPLSMDSPGLGLGALTGTSDHFEIKTEFELDQDHCFTPSYEKINDPTSHAAKDVPTKRDHMEFPGGKSKVLAMDKSALEMVGKCPVFNSHIGAEPVATPNESVDELFSCVQVNRRQRKNLKSRKKSGEKGEARQLQDLCGTWPSYGKQFQQLDDHYSPLLGQSFPSSILNQQRPLQGPESSQYKHFSNPLAAPVYGNVVNQIPAATALPKYHSGEVNHQLVPFFEVPSANSDPLNKSPDASVKPPIMTPQEKIKKLRRRQQMRAMLAIQKQQQQFSHPSEHNTAQKCSHEQKIMHIEGGNTEENLSIFPFDSNSPIEHDDSNTISMAIDDYSVEDAVIHGLQDIIEKMDMRIRLCIQDSLFRLAQSALQRQYASDTSSTNKSTRDEFDALAKEEIKSHNRFASRLPDMETETNPIDRTVAHLLFHRPEFSGKLPEIPESPVSTKQPFVKKATGLMRMPLGFVPESSENMQNVFDQVPCTFAEVHQSKSSTRVDTSENASSSEATDGVAMKVETTQ